MPNNTWICDRKENIVSSPVLNIVIKHCHSSEDGREHLFYTMTARDWCNIIPITEEGKIVLVKQYRIGSESHTLEIPGGVIDADDGDPSIAALRELSEETGYVPTSGSRCEYLGSTLANPAIQNNRCHSLVVGPVRKLRAQQLDSGEMIETMEIAPEEIPGMIARGEINHALMLNTFFFLMLRAESTAGSLPGLLRAFAAPSSAPA